MNTREMFIKLLDNPEKKFESVSNMYPTKKAMIVSGALHIMGGDSGSTSVHLSLSREWREIREPMNPYELMEKFINNEVKSFRIEMPDGTIHRQPYLNKLGCMTYGSGFEFQMFKEGKWYPED